MGKKSGFTGPLAVTFIRSGSKNATDFKGSNGQTFHLDRPVFQRKREWTLHQGGKMGEPVWNVVSQGMFPNSSRPDYIMEDLQSRTAYDLSRRKKWLRRTLSFIYNGRQYHWTHSWKGFRLVALDEEDLPKHQQEIFAKFKRRRCTSKAEVRIYEAGTQLPVEAILLSGAVVDRLYDQQCHAAMAGGIAASC